MGPERRPAPGRLEWDISFDAANPTDLLQIASPDATQTYPITFSWAYTTAFQICEDSYFVYTSAADLSLTVFDLTWTVTNANGNSYLQTIDFSLALRADVLSYPSQEVTLYLLNNENQASSDGNVAKQTRTV